MYGYYNYNKLTLSDILERVSEIEIYQIVIKDVIRTGAKYLAPYRYDRTPGCIFKYVGNSLYFLDYTLASSRLSCIDVLMKTLGFSYDETLSYIDNYFNIEIPIPINKKTKQITVDFSRPVMNKKKKVEIVKDKTIKYLIKDFDLKDKNFWERYEITKSNLENDKVYSISHYLAKDVNNIFYTVYSKGNMYCYTDFESNNVKIYRPYEKKELKWFTNCTQHDIGGINNLEDNSDVLIITKSYKDYRVIKNQGYNVIWFQNEGMIPNIFIIKDLISRYSNIVIWFDNDATGIKNGNIVCEYIKSMQYENQTVKLIYLPVSLLEEKITDASDFISKKGKQELNKIITRMIF